MQYELYIDVFFLINIGIDWCLLKLTGQLLSIKTGRLRILCGAFAGALLTCMIWIAPIECGWVKLICFYIVVNVVMIRVGLKIREGRKLILACIVLMICAVFMAGILHMLRQYIRMGSLFLVCVIAGYYTVCGSLWVLQYLTRRKNVICKIRLEHEDRIFEGEALIDTGNRLRDPQSGLPVSVLDKEIAEYLLEMEKCPKLYEISYHSIGKENGSMKAFRLEKMEFPEKENQVIKNGIVAISEEPILCGGCRMILNPDIF